ncbi:DNA helicase INO80 complex-1-like protein [Panicum miliaceum]|uniref:DNA helicase INO80 complex-1-like protein n=1 Tax=Panicum miliaceum TaxID=4540 RepID=A0A3L6R9H8_PANMI|nr:DNA helicase INO80 complex-1-like protein [Panicum miliaceum]
MEKSYMYLGAQGLVQKIEATSMLSLRIMPRVPQGTSPEEIFEALRGIPRLARADLLRAYSVLIRDDRRFRYLMALPKAGDGERERGGAALPGEIYNALKAIRPRLARADLLRAYSALVRDDRKFRSLMALPEDMRKDWLLMEVADRRP